MKTIFSVNFKIYQRISSWGRKFLITLILISSLKFIQNIENCYTCKTFIRTFIQFYIHEQVMNVEVSPRKQHYLHSMTILKGLANSKNLNSFYLVPFYKLHLKKQHENIIVVLNSHLYILVKFVLLYDYYLYKKKVMLLINVKITGMSCNI